MQLKVRLSRIIRQSGRAVLPPERQRRETISMVDQRESEVSGDFRHTSEPSEFSLTMRLQKSVSRHCITGNLISGNLGGTKVG